MMKKGYFAVFSENLLTTNFIEVEPSKLKVLSTNWPLVDVNRKANNFVSCNAHPPLLALQVAPQRKW